MSYFRLIKSHYGLDSYIRHMGYTNYAVQAVPPDNSGDGMAVPVFGGNTKNEERPAAVLRSHGY